MIGFSFSTKKWNNATMVVEKESKELDTPTSTTKMVKE